MRGCGTEELREISPEQRTIGPALVLVRDHHLPGYDRPGARQHAQGGSGAG